MVSCNASSQENCANQLWFLMLSMPPLIIGDRLLAVCAQSCLMRSCEVFVQVFGKCTLPIPFLTLAITPAAFGASNGRCPTSNSKSKTPN